MSQRKIEILVTQPTPGVADEPSGQPSIECNARHENRIDSGRALRSDDPVVKSSVSAAGQQRVGLATTPLGFTGKKHIAVHVTIFGKEAISPPSGVYRPNADS